MLILKPVLGFFTWTAYSAVQRRSLQQGTFSGMQCLSELRHPDGNASMVPSFISHWRPISPTSWNSTAWHILAGDSNTPRDSIQEHRQLGLSCCYGGEPLAAALYGRSPASTFSITELVQQQTDVKPIIVDDVPTRANWDQSLSMENIRKLTDCCDARDGTSSLVDGAYAFCYRDYINFEELSGLLGQRFCLDWFLLRLQRTTQLNVKQNGTVCTLVDNFRTLGFLPVRIKWRGEIRDGTSITWDTTIARLGWRWLGRTLVNPKISEKLRADPWTVYLPRDNPSGDVAILYRQNSGKLVFAREDFILYT